jgi:uncharacterized protein (DUF2141 family)
MPGLPVTPSGPSKTLQGILLSGVLLISSPLMQPQAVLAAPRGCTLVLHVAGMRNQKGEIGAALYRSKDGWPEDLGKALKSDSVKFHGNTATLTFHDLSPGQYAVAVVHDENVNYKLDRNFVGWPTEGFGFTRNPRVLLTAPTFNEAAIHVGCPSTETSVQLIYK